MLRPIIGITAHTETLNGVLKCACNVAYVHAIEANGGLPLLIPPGQAADAIPQLIDLIDGLLLPGGVDVSPEWYGERPHARLGKVDPELDALELPLAARAYEHDIPILGICRGVQALTVALGGSLYQDLPSEFPGTQHEVRQYGRGHRTHEITVAPHSRLAAALGQETICVNSMHHQAVRTVPERLTVVARSPDGIIEAVEDPEKRFVVGVQCHPEEMWETTAPEFARLFVAFIQAAAEFAQQKRASSESTVVAKT
jgi:putative glutamine amidotransferase